jgi:hypothetical protein
LAPAAALQANSSSKQIPGAVTVEQLICAIWCVARALDFRSADAHQKVAEFAHL